ncbi:ribonuclease H-like domain-containing protein [Tahibacter amnicola]|uniref:Ribonuclease H-like domain-containing protein n=1 Tax=Tahibacter amnicola TaxID=2976241 RepID=A0ABY6BIT9_9GAMM|nr:ribonuclease H-like domain-containing protein [Tahibacter amnicola]UXI69412.1 ribonuclease H-like domain-containing protein [Tahibacter amnicola]
MTALAERIRRLRLQAGATAGVAGGAVAPVVPAPPPPQAGVDRSAEVQRLRRLLGMRTAAAAPAPRRPDAETALCGDAVAPGVREVTREIPLPAASHLLPPRWADGVPLARERFLCFDTETTGLAGGSGTRAFMIGAADWRGERLRIRQLYLTAMAGEAAMLDRFAQWLTCDTVLVSYNGRCYDAPLLATRYRLNRRANPLAGLPHVDLLHPVRRAYRGIWENCRLATLERRLLHIVREDDLPGAAAPAAWLSFLRHGKGDDLLRVVEHNRQDLVTLARLLQRLDTRHFALD